MIYCLHQIALLKAELTPAEGLPVSGMTAPRAERPLALLCALSPESSLSDGESRGPRATPTLRPLRKACVQGFAAASKTQLGTLLTGDGKDSLYKEPGASLDHGEVPKGLATWSQADTEPSVLGAVHRPERT